MTVRPALSIVVPTNGRPGPIRRLLRALTRQQHAPAFEVTIVADGVVPAATGVGDPGAWPYTVHVVTQPHAGAAKARNNGAARAASDLLLFMDDDVEPGPGVVAAHVAFHARQSRRIGTGELVPHSIHGGTIGAALCGWWEVMGDALADPRHRFTFRDVLTGHCSMSRRTFDEIDGFDPSLRCHEDFDFGFRALERGFDIGFVRDAHAVHHDDSDLNKIVRRKFDEGIASVQLIAKHPRLFRSLVIGRPVVQGRVAKMVRNAAAGQSTVSSLIPPALRLGMRTFDALSMRDKWRVSLDMLMDHAFWSGVVQAAGGSQQVRAIREQTGPVPRAALVVDLAPGLERAERVIDESRPHALRVMFGEHLVGELEDEPGAERLRGVHLRPILLKNMAPSLAIAALRSGLLPEVFHGVAGHAEFATVRADTGAGQAA